MHFSRSYVSIVDEAQAYRLFVRLSVVLLHIVVMARGAATKTTITHQANRYNTLYEGWQYHMQAQRKEPQCKANERRGACQGTHSAKRLHAIAARK